MKMARLRTKQRGKAVALCALAAVLLAGVLVLAKQTGPPRGEPTGTVEVNKKLLDSPLDDIQWVTSRVVFVLTENGQVYRSTDAGKGWVNQSSKMPGASSGNPSVRSMHVSPVDPNKLFFMGHGVENWVTTDMGKTYRPTEELDIHEVRLHPRQSNWMLVASMSPGCSAPTKVKCYKVMFVSKNFGDSWAEAVTYAVQFDWAPTKNSTKPRITPEHDNVADASAYKDPEPRHEDDLVFATVHHHKSGNQRFGSWDKNINLLETYDYFKTGHELVKHGNRFLFGEHKYMFVAAVNPYEETEVSLQVSRDLMHHYGKREFRSAMLPVELTEHSYTVLDTSEGSVFLHVNHQAFDNNAPTGHVYISDWSGVRYSLSLPYNHRSADGKCDFEKVEGLEGIYLANFVDEKDTEYLENWTQQKAQSGRRLRAKTVITFDKGAIWSYLEAPRLDSKGDRISCPDGCHLHLHGITDLYGPFYSSRNALGLIMSTGTVGQYLQESSDSINTYLSRDAGLHWFEVAKGSHIYEFGDHGGLIVMAYDEDATKELKYSWDEGLTWKSVEISDVPIQVENVIVQPEATTQKFVVYGWQDSSGVLIYVDFSELHTRECKGFDAPGSASSDYERWTPTDGRSGSGCLLGHKNQYIRRKRESQCFNPEVYERPISQENCACRAEDFECDYGFYRPSISSRECIMDQNVTPEPVPPKHCEDVYYVTRGYRRVAGDTCTNGAEWDRIMTPCPFWGSHHTGKIVLFVLAVVAVSLAVVTGGAKVEWLEDVVESIKRKFERNRPYIPVDGGQVPHMEDDDFGLDDSEFGQSAHLIRDLDRRDRGGDGGGGAKEMSSSAGSSASGSNSAGSAASGSNSAAGRDFGPLPKMRKSAAEVPRLAKPPVDSSTSLLDMDEFDV